MACVGCSEPAQQIAAGPEPRLIHLGLTEDPTTSIIVHWQTSQWTTPVIRFAVGLDVPPERFTVGSAVSISDGTDHHHQAHLRGLSAGAIYTYQVGGVALDGSERFSPPFAFRTAPDLRASPDAEVVVGVLADIEARYDLWAQLATQVQQRVPDLVVVPRDARRADAMQLTDALFATTVVVDGSVEYGFVRLAANGDAVVVEHDRARAVVDMSLLRTADAAAVVRVRQHSIVVDAFGAGGVRVALR
jgi:hypothetical protein